MAARTTRARPVTTTDSEREHPSISFCGAFAGSHPWDLAVSASRAATIAQHRVVTIARCGNLAANCEWGAGDYGDSQQHFTAADRRFGAARRQ